MPNIQLTHELAALIKQLRKKTNTTAKELAEQISKSTGYISNVENMKTMEINIKDLNSILKFFTQKNSSCDEIINKFFDESVVPKLSQEEKTKRKSYIIFDKQYRKIQISQQYIDFVNSELAANSFTSNDVITELNTNRYMTNHSIPKNELVFDEIGGILSESILFDLPNDFLQRILDSEIKKTNYINLQGIIYAINLLKGVSEEDSINESAKKLFDLKVYTLSQRNQLLQDERVGIIVNETMQPETDLPDEIQEYYKIIKALITIISEIKDFDTVYVNSKLSTLVKNLSIPETSSFTFGCLGLPFDAVKYLSNAQKAELYRDLCKLITERGKESFPDDMVIEKFE